MNLDLLNMWNSAVEFWNSLDVGFHAGIGLALFAVFFFTAMRMPNFGSDEAAAPVEEPQEELVPVTHDVGHQIP